MSFKGWKEVRLGDSSIEIIDGDRGKNYPNGADFTNDGYCLFLNAKNVTKDGFDFIDKMFISKEKDEILRKGKLKRNDIVLTTRGTVGNVAFYSDEIAYENIRINSGMVIFRCLDSYVFPQYVYWLFRSPSIQKQIVSIKTGSAQPQLPISVMKNLKFWLPSLNEQKSIVSILSALDEKIKINNQINKTLEAIAQALFKHWFVDFEFPNEDGEPYKSSGGEMVESELGMIPKGWRVHRNSEVFKLLYGKALKAEDRCTGLYPVYGSNGIVGYHNEALVKGPGIVIGRKGNPGTVNFAWDDFYPIDTTFYVDSKVSKIYLYYALKAQNLDKLGTDSAVPGLNRNIAYMNLILVPNEDNLKCFDETILPILNYIKCKESENNQLLALRDTLLPKLMSGEIRVPIDQEGEV